jgi:hypothetical protein
MAISGLFAYNSKFKILYTGKISAGIMTQLHVSGLKSEKVQDIFLYSKCLHQLWGSPSLLFNWSTALSWGVKAARVRS